jgi:hypothetical protein
MALQVCYHYATHRLTKEELRFMKKLSTPIKIQNYLDTLPINFEKNGETYMSPRRVLRERKAHCFEGALLAALALALQGEKPLLLDLTSYPHDDDHVVALYRKNGYWGAISKTNHAALRFRDPIYRSVRELALSYFHEYFMNDTGKKVLATYSDPFDLSKVKTNWVTAEEDLFSLMHALDTSPHHHIVPKNNKKFIRRADSIERKAGKIVEWKKSDKGT